MTAAQIVTSVVGLTMTSFLLRREVRIRRLEHALDAIIRTAVRRFPTVWRAVAEPTLFMDAKFNRTVRYFATARRAHRWGRRYCHENPHGEVEIHFKPRRGTT